MDKIKLDYNDLLIKPKSITNINSRKKINPFIEDGFLPLITAPMDTVIGVENYKAFKDNKIIGCFPRCVENPPYGFKSISLDRAKGDLFDDFTFPYHSTHFICIDVANGHMDSVLETVKLYKKHKPNVVLMVGNIANPETYKLLSEAGADYIRCGIGNGGGCLTTQNTGVGYPMASLITECFNISLTLDKSAYIVADGGIKDYSDIIKALGLGADFVMVGNVFNKSLESSGENFLFKKIKIPQQLAEYLYNKNIKIYKSFRGMSTKEVQKKWGSKQLKTSEGVVRFRKVEYSLYKWVENFEDYLRSAMSYSGANDLYGFIGNAEFIQITENAYKRFNK